MIRPTVALGVTIVLAVVGCRSEPVDPQELLTATAIGQSDLRKGQLQLAEEQFRKVVSLAPRDPLGHANLGLTYLRGERYAEAENALRRARRLGPENSEVGLILAKLFSVTGRVAQARRTLEELRPDGRTLYALAELDAQDTAAAGRYRQRLKEVLTFAPTNLAVRLKLAELYAHRGDADSSLMYLEEVRRIAPEPPRDSRPHLDSALRQLRLGNVAAARAPLDRFLHLIALTSPYQASLEEVKWVDGPLVGRPVLAFNPQTLISMRGIMPASRPTLRFVDVTGEAGLPAPGPPVTALALGDYDNDGVDDLFVSATSAGGTPVVRLYRVQGGYMADVTDRLRLTTSLPAGAAHATFADADNDGWLDLFVIGMDGRGYLLRNDAGAAFESVGPKAGLTDLQGARTPVFLDADHDGDLDLFLPGDTTRLYRNNLDGTFTEISRSAGFGSVGRTLDAAFGDFDGDGRIDLFVVKGDGRGALFRNAGLQAFRDVTGESGIESRGITSVAVGDFDNNGRLDIATAAQGRARVWTNRGGGRFAGGNIGDDARANTEPRPIAALDYDNDGWLDLVAAGAGGLLLRNEGNGRFVTSSQLRAGWLSSALLVVPSDADGDGDQDLFLGDGASGVRLLRNDGGNARMAMQVQLTGLRTGSGKNNTFGLGATIEVRAGEIYQTRVVTSRVTSFGLGPHIKADVVRVLWTNGVPETIYFPGTDADVLELEHLKGSCAFVYTWDGKGFRFVTDVMWRSALGMPLGLMGGGGTAYAPAAASREFIRIPGAALQPRDGRYVLQITEELWETAYLDEIKLLAVDHPDSIEVFVDERFPPVTEELRMYQASNPRIPRSARDDGGHDVLPALRAKDDVYVSNLKPLQYQGLVAPHDLILDLGDGAGHRGSHLFLQGWVYPTDASINVALSQQSRARVTMPSLEVRDARGEWRTAIANIGFPSGKDKTVVVDLEGKFPTKDHHVRIRTNMQVYWDHAFVATDASGAVKTAELRPIAADLHARGYSRMYRKGGRYGPHWFAYGDVSKESPWRPIEGAFTRYGDVRPLLESADDRYIVMAPGDEATVEFDAAALEPVRTGWKRTFLLYTDGWIKDADLNTAFGNTVEPLPFHAMREYPYAPGEAYPADPGLERYRREYNTRRITRR
jgi:Flp pilus assembly protein TadD